MNELEFIDAMAVLAKTLRAPLAGSSGVSTEQWSEVVNQLGSAPGRTLREFHFGLGRQAIVMHSLDRFVPYDELKVDADGALTICVEHQEQMSWVVKQEDIREDDPQVFQRQPETDQWFKQSPSLSLFLLNEIAWQMVNGLPSAAVCKMTDRTQGVIRENIPIVAFRLGYGYTTRADAERGIVVLSLRDPQKIYFGAHDDETLLELEQQMGIELDWL